VQHRAGILVLVAADRFAGDPVDVAEPAQPAARQDRVHRRGGHTEPAGDLHWPEALFAAQMHDLADQRLRGSRWAVFRP
jgi:hypothetical protein